VGSPAQKKNKKNYKRETGEKRGLERKRGHTGVISKSKGALRGEKVTLECRSSFMTAL